jgi:hypothetical protein
LLKEKHLKLITLGCCSYQLNLAIGDIIKIPQVSEIWEPVLEVARYFKRHGIATALIKSYALETSPFKAFQVPGKTRWQGKLYTTQALISNIAAIQKAIFYPGILSGNATPAEKAQFEHIKLSVLNPTFWDQARQLQDLLQPFLRVTIALESNSLKLSHCYTNFGWLIKEGCSSRLVPRPVIKPLIKLRFQKAWHPLIIIAYLANPL